MFKRSDDFPGKGPNVVIDVASVDDALDAVEGAGGKRLTDKQAVGEMGFTAYFSDTEGNVVGLWESA